MHRCPQCGTLAHVKQTRASEGAVLRRYHCPKCAHRFSTREEIVTARRPSDVVLAEVGALLKEVG